MIGTKASEMIEHLSADEARNLMLRLRLHIENQEASMTPAELHEHLKEVPDQLFSEAQELSWRFKREMSDLVENYIVRHGDWERDEYYDEYHDEEECEVDERKISDEFYDDIRRLSDTLLAEFFSPEEDDKPVSLWVYVKISDNVENDLQLRNSIRNELERRGFGQCTGSGVGFGEMDFSFNVDDEQAARHVVAEVMDDIAPGREYRAEVAD